MFQNKDIFRTAKRLKVGDIIRFRLLMRNPVVDHYESAKVAAVSFDETRQQVNITYIPCGRFDSVNCGFGCTFVTPHDDNANKRDAWGWQTLEIVRCIV